MYRMHTPSLGAIRQRTERTDRPSRHSQTDVKKQNARDDRTSPDPQEKVASPDQLRSLHL